MVTLDTPQVHEGDLIAQSAGFLDRNDYSPRLGLAPDELAEFKEMSLQLSPDLEEKLSQLQQAGRHYLLQKKLCSAYTTPDEQP